ncbi:MAG: acyl-CoA dehydrogenase [Myxococcales bacterium]|nr:acyl-CoA dehydrogenase [Myxococcales bacterium]MDD9969348.1 acyl-CoA dehydrogenase [Myxococcales bacterium]
MALTLNGEQQLLRDSARNFVSTHAPVSHLRSLRDRNDDRGYSPVLWEQMVELGWAGIAIPESYGGAGLGLLELGLVMEECGRTLAPTPLLSTVLLAGNAVLEAGSEAQKSALLPAVCEGNKVMALAFEERSRFAPYQVACKAEARGTGFRLSGRKTFVLDGHIADTLVVTARTQGEVGDRDGISLFLVDPKQAGVKIERTTTLDSRNAAQCSFEAVDVPGDALLGELHQGADVLDRVLDRATVCLSAEMLGLVSQTYDVTLDYLKTRVQFDARIGSFQALQHRAVDMFCELELCKSLVLEALTAADEGRDDATMLASAVKARLTDASRWITRQAVQLHGGIGMTDEHDIGLYLKRGAATEQTLGDSAYHLDRFASLRGF